MLLKNKDEEESEVWQFKAPIERHDNVETKETTTELLANWQKDFVEQIQDF